MIWFRKKIESLRVKGFFLQLVVGSVLQSNGNVEFSQADLTSEEARDELKQEFL